jgi:hypothetical protein
VSIWEEAPMMKRLALILCVTVGTLAAQDVSAADPFATAIEGPYLLIQDDKFQRLLSFDSGGTVSQVSDQQSLLGFTTGQGAWRSIGADRASARVIDFSYGIEGGKRIGPSVIIYDLTFSELKSGIYQKVRGTISGKVYPAGQDPLDPTTAPVRTFGIGFTGQRVTAE